ncbi:MAG: CPBP family intramembrane metalloprotease [Herpetosiphonaceae bacterium]|nr:CPBP family intramembrane metalloprotease [Herpetosiphonaceae bacterium]
MNTRARLNLRGIGWFLAIAFGLAWILTLPMYLDGRGVSSPWVQLILFINFTPAIATLIVTRWISPLAHVRRSTGLRWGAKGSYWGWYWLFGWLGLTILVMVAPFVGALFGHYPLDLQHFSGYRAALESTAQGQQTLSRWPLETIVQFTMLSLPLVTLLISPVNFGEEWGWRGYLLPQLLPLGQWPALLISGAIWGLWHAPLILLGLNYPQHPILGVGLMVIFCTIIGIILGWLRLATGSVWPAVLGHAGIDATSQFGAILMLTQVGVTYDTAQVTILGWTGWLLPLLFIVCLVVTRRLPVHNSPDTPSGTISMPLPLVASRQASA